MQRSHIKVEIRCHEQSGWEDERKHGNRDMSHAIAIKAHYCNFGGDTSFSTTMTTTLCLNRKTGYLQCCRFHWLFHILLSPSTFVAVCTFQCLCHMRDHKSNKNNGTSEKWFADNNFPWLCHEKDVRDRRKNWFSPLTGFFNCIVWHAECVPICLNFFKLNSNE